MDIDKNKPYDEQPDEVKEYINAIMSYEPTEFEKLKVNEQEHEFLYKFKRWITPDVTIEERFDYSLFPSFAAQFGSYTSQINIS